VPRHFRRMLFRALLPLACVFTMPAGPREMATRAPDSYIVPPSMFRAIAAEYSGEHAFENIRNITRFHRIQASPGFSQAREWVVERLNSYGITDVVVEKFPSDGRTPYSTHVGPLSWTVREGELWVEAPFQERLCRFTDQAVCLSTQSNGGEWRGEALDVGAGTDASSYAGKDVRGKIVFATGYAGIAHRQAVLMRGALGVVIYPAADDRPEYPDLVRYNGLWLMAGEKDKAGFGFQISARQWEKLRPDVRAGRLRLHAKVVAQLGPGALEVTSAYLRGSDPSREILLVAHLDHYRFGANDNASGSASLIEIARTVKALVEQKKLPPLTRTLHFLWVPEHNGTVAWLTRHPEVSQHAIAAINMDMVGEDLVKTNSRMNISHTPESLPSFINALMEDVAEQVEAAELYSPNGSHHLFFWRMAPYSNGSDHDMFNDGNVRVPAVQIGHWPDWTHHTNEDTLDKVDTTTLLRSGLLATTAAVWMATAGDDDGIRLAHFLDQLPIMGPSKKGDAGKASIEVTQKEPLLATGARDSQRIAPAVYPTSRRLQISLLYELRLHTAALRSVRPLLTQKGVERLERWVQAEHQPEFPAATLRQPGEVRSANPMERVPKRNCIGPINDRATSFWFPHAMGPEWPWWVEQSRSVPFFTLIVYEAGNFADGKRTLAEIQDSVAAEYGDLPAGLIEGIFNRLSNIGLVEWVGKK
jgi:hypothetical protein